MRGGRPREARLAPVVRRQLELRRALAEGQRRAEERGLEAEETNT
jgi:hypothetical protein